MTVNAQVMGGLENYVNETTAVFIMAAMLNLFGVNLRQNCLPTATYRELQKTTDSLP